LKCGLPDSGLGSFGNFRRARRVRRARWKSRVPWSGSGG
jgi:hypothetical protein